jgi:hypothetical protein
MKYIKKFEENKYIEEILEIKEFAKNSLSFLLDNGYYIDCSPYGRVKGNDEFFASIGILKTPNSKTTGFARIEEFSYSEIKDSIIPFIQMSKHLYDIDRSIKFTTKNQRPGSTICYYDIDELDSDKIPEYITSIRLIFNL